MQVTDDDELGVGRMLSDEPSDGSGMGEVGVVGVFALLIFMGVFGEGCGLGDEGFGSGERQGSRR